MSRWKKKIKAWLLRKTKKLNKRKSLKRKNKYKTSHYVLSKNLNGQRPKITLKPPKNFSLINNTEPTMSFFADFAREINKNIQGSIFFIDSSNVELASVDALIYLIAILQNDIVNSQLRYSFVGNYPKSESARKVYNESGFNNYVKVESKITNLLPNNNKKKITCGERNDTNASKELCEFVMLSLGKSRRDILPIQKVLIELMSNVYHHAYEKNNFMAKKWYMYAEYIDNTVKCIFVDTGLGIANTARKNLLEKIKTDDSKIIKSIFNGDFRTSTKEKFRGNGLSSVRENVKSSIFESFEVISGKGRCIIPKKQNSEDILSISYNRRLYGTLFKFDIK